MSDRTDSERLDWVLEQNRRGYYMVAVTTRADVDSLMDEEAHARREPFPVPRYAAATPEERSRND